MHNEIDTYDTFGKDRNFVIAAGLSGSKLLKDPDYGQLKFYMKKWEVDFEATFALDELKQRPCTEDDLVTKEG